MGGHFFETLVQDVHFAVRVLRKSPGFTFAAVVTLALAIGANAVVFGIMDGLLLRPLKVPQWETLWGTMYGTNPGWQSYPNYLDLRNRNHSFEDLAAFKFAFSAMDTGKDLALANGFATTRAVLMNSSASGLSVRFFKVIIAIFPRALANSTGNALSHGRTTRVFSLESAGSATFQPLRLSLNTRLPL